MSSQYGSGFYKAFFARGIEALPQLIVYRWYLGMFSCIASIHTYIHLYIHIYICVYVYVCRRSFVTAQIGG